MPRLKFIYRPTLVKPLYRDLYARLKLGRSVSLRPLSCSGLSAPWTDPVPLPNPGQPDGVPRVPDPTLAEASFASPDPPATPTRHPRASADRRNLRKVQCAMFQRVLTLQPVHTHSPSPPTLRLPDHQPPQVNTLTWRGSHVYPITRYLRAAP